MSRNILLDIDGVLANFYAGFADYLNKNYNAGLDINQEPVSYSFSEWGPGLESIDMDKASYDWIIQGGFLNLPAYSEIDNFTNKLIKLGNVDIVTARIGDFEQKFSDKLKKKIKSDTYKWLYDHNIKINGDIYFCHNKVDLCLDKDISIIIEDKLSTVLKASRNGIHSILIDRGWNYHPDRYKVYRAKNHNDILKFVKKITL